MRLALHVAQLHTCALLLGQGINELPHNLHFLALHGALVGVSRRCGVALHRRVVERCVLVLVQPQSVECHVAADGECERLDVLDGIPRVATVPDTYERVLHDVLCLLAAQRDA